MSEEDNVAHGDGSVMKDVRPRRRATSVLSAAVSPAYVAPIPPEASDDQGDEEDTVEIEWTPTEATLDGPSDGQVCTVLSTQSETSDTPKQLGSHVLASAQALERDHIHRLRSGRRNTESRPLGNDHSRIIVEVISTFCVIDMRTAIEVCRCIGGATSRYYTMRIGALERAKVLRRMPSRDFQLRGLLGRSPIVVPGEQWALAVNAFGADPASSIWTAAKRGPLIERLALTHLVAARVLEGWTLVQGEKWIAGLGALDRTRALGNRAPSVAEALRDGLVHFKDPARVWGLLPPTGAQHPAILIGKGATEMSKIASVLATVRRIAPVEVICYRRSAASVDRVRRVAMAKLGGAGDSFVTVLPSPAGTRWKRHRRDLVNRLEAAVGGSAAASLSATVRSGAISDRDANRRR
ncbi:MAG: hypothetical protein ACR2M1_08595 [Gemmatimonadaceae bacterium]